MMKLLNIGDVETEEDYKLVHVACNQKYMGYIALSYEADQGAETVYNAWADAGITKYAVFGKDPEGIYEELSESKKCTLPIPRFCHYLKKKYYLCSAILNHTTKKP